MRALASLCSVLVVAACGGASDEPSPDAMPPVVVPDAMPPVVVPDAAVPDAMPPANIRFVDLADNAIVAGLQRTAIESFDDRGVVRMELFIDTGRLGEDTIVPFAIEWTTRDFADGPHELRARAHFGDGTSADLPITVRIDNTPPVITVPDSIVSDTFNPGELEVAVTDYTGVAEVRIDSETLTAPPYRIRWQRGCGQYGFGVSAKDLAGNYAHDYHYIQTIDPNDRDCDHVYAPSFGGLDCDDNDRTTYPGAPDDGSDAIDHDCDGMPGVDADGDHVATRSTGGDDCDDTRVDVHGAQLRWRDIVLQPTSGELMLHGHDFARARIGGAELHVLESTSEGRAHRGFGLDGVERFAHRLPALGWPQQFAVGQGELLIAYGVEGEVRMARWSGGEWTTELVASGTPSQIEVAVRGATVHVAYLASGTLHLATRGAGGWSARELVSNADLTRIGRVDVERSAVVAYGPRVVVRVRHGSLPVQVQSIPFPDRGGEVQHATALNGELIYTRDYPDSGCYDEDGDRISSSCWYYRVVRLPFLGEVLAAGNGGWFATLDGDQPYDRVRQRRMNGIALNWPGVSEGDDIVFLGRGLAIPEGSLPPAADAAGDGLDSDCDGIDG
jgi:hypothetical protein